MLRLWARIPTTRKSPARARRPFTTREYGDISQFIDTMLNRVAWRAPQIGFTKEQDGFDMPEYVRTAARYRCCQCEVIFAEGFIPERVLPSLAPRQPAA